MEFYDAMKMEPEQVAEPEQILRKLMGEEKNWLMDFMEIQEMINKG